MSGGSLWTGSPVTNRSVANETEVSCNSDLHHSHVKGGDLPEAGAVHLLPANLLQDDAGLVDITGECGQVERRELVPEVISMMSVMQIDQGHLRLDSLGLGRAGGALVGHNPQVSGLLAQGLNTEVRHTQPRPCELLDGVAVGEHCHPLHLGSTARLL